MKFVTILIIGLSRTGKSTLINSIIGGDLLDAPIVECTATHFVIRHSYHQEPILFEVDDIEEEPSISKIVKNKNGKPAIGYEAVKNQIKLINK